MRTLGIDGCRGGWIAVAFNTNGVQRFEVFTDIKSALSASDDCTLIDIPIGLPDTKYRRCDLSAREMLGAARSRVFLGARRPLLRHLTASDYAGANRWAKCDGAGISRQLWGILRKIDEVDRVITPDLQGHIREGHPELSFLRTNGGTPVPKNKKTPDGFAARIALLKHVGFIDIENWLPKLRGSGAGRDDLLDACALAWSARDPRRVACAREKDARGLTMDIWY